MRTRMHTLLLLPLVLALGLTGLCSCVVMHEKDADGGTATYASLGGKGAYRRGTGVVHNHEKSFRDGALTAATLAGSYYSAAVGKAREATAQTAAREATKQHSTAAREATRQVISGHKLEATRHAISTGGAEAVMPVTVGAP